MSKEILISEITADIETQIDITTINQIQVSFQLDTKIQTTETVSYTGEKPLIWSNIINIAYGTDQSLDIKLYNDKVLLGKGILIIPSTLQEQINNIELLSENKQLIAKLSLKTNIQEINKPSQVVQQTPQVVEHSQVKTKTQKTIQLPESPQKSQKSIQSNKNQQPQPVQNTLSNSIKQPSQKSIHQSQKIKVQQPQQQQEYTPKKSEIKLSDRPARKITQKSEIKPSEKVIQNQITQKVQLQNSNIQDSSLMGTQSLNKSRDTLKLPNIGDVSKNFGDKIYDKQSSATLQKSILVFSVPKAPRFGSGPKYAGEPSYYVDSCFKPSSTKGVGFGFGNKRQFPEWLEKNMKENPAPGAYFYQSKPSLSMQKKGNLTSHLHSRGPSFGISYKFYEKVTIPKEKSPQRSTVSNQRLKPIFKSN